MTVHYFGDSPSVLNQFIFELRDREVQKDSMRFRRNIERVGEVLGYELSKSLNSNNREVETPFGPAEIQVPSDSVVVCSVLRAGLPLHQGILNYFDRAENAFVSAFRKHPEGSDDFEVIVKYLAAPDLNGKTLILSDPMLATGKTLENVLTALRKHGEPEQIHVISVIGSRAGLAHAEKVFPKSAHLWIAAIDEDLNSRGYILPGLGDAGDLAFGEKL
jgi:uracil phosphoribosyltransferase